MEWGKWLKHAYAISIMVLLHINASLSLGHHHANLTRCVERERDALLAVKRDLVDNYNLLSSWGSGSEAQNEDCCRWERVYCDNQTGHVLRLDLGGDDLWKDVEITISAYTEYTERLFLPAFEGTLSPQLIQLHDLTYLNLSYNSFNESQIPAFIGSLTNLRYLDLRYARFGGQIPSHALGNLTHLTYLDLSDNDFKWSQIPAFIGCLTSLSYLDLNGAGFTGQIPSHALGNLTHLTYLDLSHNDFSRSQIPAFIGSLTSLRYLDLSWASFTGQIPSHALGNLSHLQYLNLGFNQFYHYSVENLGENLVDTLFVENLNWLSHLSSLKYLDLSFTNFSNVFDWLETINKLPNLRNLSLSYCRLPPPIIPNSFSDINTSKFLAHVDLSGATTITSSIFKWLCNYNTTLVHLDLSGNQLGDSTLDVFTNMSSLAHLDLSDNPLEGGIPKSISQLCSLQSLRISSSSLDGLLSEFVQRWSSTCPQNSLQSLDLFSNDLAGSFPNLTNFSSLKELSLSDNQLSGMIPESIGQLSSLRWLFLSGNRLSGRIPESIGNLSSLGRFYLSENLLTGKIPESIGQISSLRELHLSGNRLSGRIPESIGQLSLLERLDLSTNRLSGMTQESIGNLFSLEEIDLSENLLTGITESIGQLSNLWFMNLSMNSLNGVILETHFSNLFGLSELDLSSNLLLVFNVTSDWVPPFQLSSLNLRNCNVGPDFPQWLRTQKSLRFELDISYAGISDVLPSWLWGHFANIWSIDLSHNQIRGTIGSSEVALLSGIEVRFNSNQFEGPIPSFLSNATYLDLSDNKFSEMTSFLCSPDVRSLRFLNLASNNFSGELPNCWRHLANLQLLDLSHNAFSGKLPTGLGSLFRIITLKLRSNRLVGQLPSSLKNCESLEVIDLGDNNLSKSVPEWIGVSLPNLVILMLQSNQFSGCLPSQLCHLTHLQILDFSVNEISGTIPKCLNGLASLAQEGNSSSTIRHSLNTSFAEAPMNPYYDDDATFMWKGRMSSYKNTLGLVKRIDLSSNKLTGEIPSEITHLVGLVSLNLSRNHLTGHIPPMIGNLKSLDSLDLSRNKIDGGIPTSLARINRLASLDLSYNDLSGEIPLGTQLQGFDPAFYAGNPQLCGRPLEKICDLEGTGRPNFSSNQEDHYELITEGFYISLGLGFAVGFWGVCGSLIFKRSWRYAYYKFLNASNDWLYVKAALIRRKLEGCA